MLSWTDLSHFIALLLGQILHQSHELIVTAGYLVATR